MIAQVKISDIGCGDLRSATECFKWIYVMFNKSRGEWASAVQITNQNGIMIYKIFALTKYYRLLESGSIYYYYFLFPLIWLVQLFS